MASVLKVDQLQGVSTTANVKIPGHVVQIAYNNPDTYQGFRYNSSTTSFADTGLVIQITPKIIYDNYSGINKNQFHKETENESINYGLDVDENKNAKKKTKKSDKKKKEK